MKEYITTAVVALFEGLIGLSKEQAARRSTALKRVKGKKNLYKVIKPVEFKAGEKIVLKPDKATLARLESVEEILAREKAQEEEEAKQRLEAEKVQEEKILAAAVKAVEAGDVIQSGAPGVAATEEILGFNITEAQRDKAWESMNKNS